MTTQNKHADALAAGVESFLTSLPYMAPEVIAARAEDKLRKPLAAYRKAAERKGTLIASADELSQHGWEYNHQRKGFQRVPGETK
jgi:hypothetical protein